MKNLAERPWRWMRIATQQAHQAVEVEGRRIYILPTRYGVLFAALLILMLVGALNYDNQPAYLLTFILVALGANAMLQTWRNLRGLSLELLPSPAVFCGHLLSLRSQIQAVDGRSHFAIQLQTEEQLSVQDLADPSQTLILELAVPMRKRGWYLPERLILSTRYPLGLFTAWCYIQPQLKTLVYPRPGDTQLTHALIKTSRSGASKLGEGDDDFDGLRDYRPGDSMHRVDWKSLARERGLMTKQFSGEQGAAIRINWHSLGGKDHEWKLSQLTKAVLDAEQSGVDYGLCLPDGELAAARGQRHLHACLKRLALFKASTQ